MFIGGTLNAQKYRHTCTILQRHVVPFIRSARDNMDYLRRKNIDVFRGGSRIPGIGVHMYTGVGVRFADFISFSL